MVLEKDSALCSGHGRHAVKNSVIVDYYTNSPDFEFFIKNDTTIYVKLMLQGSNITKGLEFWSDFVNKKGYWENDPRG